MANKKKSSQTGALKQTGVRKWKGVLKPQLLELAQLHQFQGPVKTKRGDLIAYLNKKKVGVPAPELEETFASSEESESEDEESESEDEPARKPGKRGRCSKRGGKEEQEEKEARKRRKRQQEDKLTAVAARVRAVEETLSKHLLAPPPQPFSGPPGPFPPGPFPPAAPSAALARFPSPNAEPSPEELATAFYASLLRQRAPTPYVPMRSLAPDFGSFRSCGSPGFY